MMPFGRLREFEGGVSGASGELGASRQVISRLMAALENAECEVKRDGNDRLDVLVPGLDVALWSHESVLPLQQFFWDRMIVSVEADGAVRYRMIYWRGTQPLLHFLVTAVFAAQAWWSRSGAFTSVQFFAALLAGHCAIAAFTVLGFGMSRRAALNRAGTV